MNEQVLHCRAFFLIRSRLGVPLKKLIGQFMKFGIVGVIAFFIDYGVMIFLTEVFGVPYLISTTISFVVSVIFNYFASMRFVFKRKDDMSRRREFIIFVVLSVCGLAINDVLMWLTACLSTTASPRSLLRLLWQYGTSSPGRFSSKHTNNSGDNGLC